MSFPNWVPASSLMPATRCHVDSQCPLFPSHMEGTPCCRRGLQGGVYRPPGLPPPCPSSVVPAGPPSSPGLLPPPAGRSPPTAQSVSLAAPRALQVFLPARASGPTLPHTLPAHLSCTLQYSAAPSLHHRSRARALSHPSPVTDTVGSTDGAFVLLPAYSLGLGRSSPGQSLMNIC